MGELDPVRLRNEAESGAIAVEAPGPTVLDNLEPCLIVSVKNLAGELSDRCLVGQIERLGAIPLDAHDRDDAVRHNTTNRRVGLKVFELDHSTGSSLSPVGLAGLKPRRRESLVGRYALAIALS